MRRLAFAFLLALCACAPARATALFQYHASCQFFCANVGLDAGDAVGGVIAISDAALAAGEVTSLYDIEAFDIDFGSFHFQLSSLGTAFVLLDAVHDSAIAFAFVTSAPGDAPGYAFANTAWIAGNSVSQAAVGGGGTLVRVLPEPAPWMLVPAALVPWWLRRGRRRPQRVQGAATSVSMP